MDLIYNENDAVRLISSRRVWLVSKINKDEYGFHARFDPEFQIILGWLKRYEDFGPSRDLKAIERRTEDVTTTFIYGKSWLVASDDSQGVELNHGESSRRRTTA